MHRVLVHNIGHHDLYDCPLDDGGAPTKVKRPSGKEVNRLGRALTLRLDQPGWSYWPEGPGLRLDPGLDGQAATGLLLPLLDAALRHVEEDHPERLEVLLVSSGKPTEGNTPIGFGEVLARYVHLRAEAQGREAPAATVVHLEGDAFILDPSELHHRLHAPLVERAAELARRSKGDWSKDFRVSLSASTGTAAMVTGLVAALSKWHPEILAVPNARQVPELKDGRLTHNRLRVRASSLLEAGARVPLQVERLDKVASLAREEMRAWVSVFLEARPTRPADRPSEEEHFWFRKGRKEVLSVLVLRRPNGELTTLRGVNMEVSLPTGTLCAERNAIGSALAQYPGLKRADLEGVAVLALAADQSWLGPCGACQEWLRKVSEVNPSFRVWVFEDARLERMAEQPLGV
jgi:hypothetical protein